MPDIHARKRRSDSRQLAEAPGTPNLDADTARLRKAQADKAEHELARIRGEFLSWETYAQVLTSIGLEQKREYETLRRRLTPRFAAMGCDSREVDAVLEEAFAGSLARLSRTREEPAEGLRRGVGRPRKKAGR